MLSFGSVAAKYSHGSNTLITNGRHMRKNYQYKENEVVYTNNSANFKKSILPFV
jgi:hypothetical protein